MKKTTTENLPDRNKVKAGYKQTEVGLIPSDWELKPLAEIGMFKKGRGIKKDEVVADGFPCVRYGELYTQHHEYIKRIYSFINSKTAKESRRINKGDILFAGSGETKEEIGKCVAFLNDSETYAGGDVIILTPKECDSLFLGFLLNHETVIKQKAQKGQGDAIVHIYPSNLQGIFIPLPPTKTEQTAIATTLSDADALITALEKLIAKKQNIKQGAMQELLTGKKRLAGFSGKWKVKKFPDVCWFQEGPGLRNWQFTTSGMKVINVTNLENGFLNLDRTDRYISIDEFKKMYQHFEIDDRDVVVASSGNSYAKVAVVRKQDLPLVMNTSVIRFKPLKNLDYNFLFAFLKSNRFKDQIDLLITGGAQPNFGPAHLKKIEIKVPPTVEEQSAIATILRDMDANIEKLQQQLAKYKMLKQGMMQQLLTGIIRLI